MQRAKALTNNKLDKMEQSIRLMEINENLKVKLHSDNAQLPTRGSPGAAGYDLYSAENKIIPAGGKTLVDTQILVVTPPGTYG